MTRKTRIMSIENGIITMQDGSKWRVSKYDEGTVVWWAPRDVVKTITSEREQVLHNLTRDQKLSATPV